MQYMDFGEDMDGPSQQDDFQHFRIPVISLNCIAPDEQIASGKFDSTIRLIARQAKTFRWPMFVRYLWDPNMPVGTVHPRACYDPNTDEPNGVFSPLAFKAAWNHLHSLFAAAGAVNVVWVWSVSGSSLAVDPLQYYPGNGNVDWVGMDDYDVNDTGFAGTFSSLYTELAPLGRPMMIAESGALGNEQEAFFNSSTSVLESQFPSVAAFLYYDSISYIPGQNEDWRIVPSAFSAFSNFANDPYLSAVYGE